MRDNQWLIEFRKWWPKFNNPPSRDTVQEWIPVRRFQWLWETSKKPRQESVTSNTRNCSWVMLSCPSQHVVNRNEFTSCYSLLLDMALWAKILLPCLSRGLSVVCALPLWLYTLLIWLLLTLSINYLMLWIKMPVAWGFRPPHI